MAHRKKKTGLGFRLPGMVAIDQNVSSGIGLTEKLSTLLEFNLTSIVKIKVTSTKIDGESIDIENSIKAETKLNKIRNVVPVKLGGLFVAFGFLDEGENEKKCLLVSFVPETMPVRSKMFLASSKGKVKREIAAKNPDVLIEEYNCSELKEISEEVYIKKKTVAKPFSEAEKARMEWDNAEKGGGESFLAKMMQHEAKGGQSAFALPGFGLGMKPSEVKKNRVASMAIAKSKDEERNTRVNFLLKLKEEKEKMEKEAREQAEKNTDTGGRGSEGEQDNDKSSNEPMEADTDKAKPVTATIDLNEVKDEDSSDEE